MFKLAWRNIWRNKNRSAISISAVFFCVLFAIVLRSFQLGSYNNLIDVVMGSYFGYVQVHAPGYMAEQTLDNSFEMNDATEAALANINKVSTVAPRLESFGLVSSGDNTKPALILGVDISRELPGLDVSTRLIEGQTLAAGQEGGCVLGKDLARQLDVHLGDTLVFISQGYMGQSAFGVEVVQGIANFRNPELNKNMVLMPLIAAQNLFAAYGRATTYAIGLPKGANHQKVVAEMKNNAALAHLDILSWEEVFPEIVQSIQADTAGGMIIIFVLYVLIAFVLLGTVIMMTAERTVEFGILVAIGMNKKLLAGVTILEKVMLTLLGGLLGIAATRPVVYYFHHNPIRFQADLGKILEDYGFEAVLPASTDWQIALTHGIIVVVLGLLVSAYAAVKILKIHPVKAMHS